MSYNPLFDTSSLNSWKIRMNAVSCFNKIFIMFLIGFFWLVSAGTLLAVPAAPGYFECKQPDGSKFSARLIGDEFYHRMETLEGHSVSLNRGSGCYEYLKVDASGKFAGTGLKPGIDDPVRNRIPYNLKESRSVIQEKISALKAARASSSGSSGQPSLSGQMQKSITLGTVRTLVILANFYDTDTAYTSDDINSLFNTTGYNQNGANGSVKDYYDEATYSQLDIQATISPWVNLPYPKAYYAPNGVNGDNGARLMVQDAIAGLDAAGFDFSPFDADGDGVLDVSLDVIHQGRGQEAGGGADSIWSHAWGLASPVTVDGVTIQAYHTEPEQLYSGMTTIGVICHEMGHAVCGLPDLYDTDGSSQGIGSWCLMASGSWNGPGGNGSRPAHFSAWAKLDCGWVTATTLALNTLDVSVLNGDGNKSIFKITNGLNSPNEYLLIENRQKSGFDNYLPGSGLLVWHVDDSIGTNKNETHYKVALLQADGYKDLENGNNRGDDGDPYPGTSDNRIISSATNPNTNSYAYGATTTVISNISDSSNTMTFDAKVVFTVTIVAGANGTVTGEKVQKIIQGEDSVSPVTAVPNAGYYFGNWTGTGGFVTTTANPLTVSDVQGNMTITANFVSSIQIATNKPTLTINEGSTATFQVKLTACPPSDKTISVLRTAGDTSVTVNPASASLVFTDINWDVYQTVTLSAAEDSNILNSSAIITLSSVGSTNKVVGVTCIDNDITLCIRASGKGTTNAPYLPGTYTVTKDSPTSISTTAITGYHLDSWTIGYGTPTFVNASGYPQTLSTTTDVTITGQATITPNFVLNAYSVNFAGVNGRINGTVSQTINHGSNCTAVTAVPNTGFKFVNWTGTNGFVTTTANPLTVTNVTSAKDITANFGPVKTSAVLTMSTSGSGTIDYPVSGSFDTGVEIPISATPSGSNFVGWSVKGNAVLNTARTAVTLYDNATVTANFLDVVPTALIDGTPELLPDGIAEDITVFTIEVPASKDGKPVTSLNIVTSGGSGTDDCDIYARFAAAPTLNDYYAKSAKTGTDEEINIINPAVGTWYIMVYGYNAYSGVSLDVTLGTDGPAKVTGLTVASPVKTDRVSLSWTAVTGSTGYEVWRSDVNDVELAKKLNSSSLTATSYNDIFTVPGEYRYYYWVRAVNGTLLGEFSSPVYGTNTASGIIVLPNGSSVTAITGNTGSIKTYSLTVPDAFQTLLEVSMSGGIGDCDIDVVKPDGTVLRRSVSGSNNELVQIQGPISAGKWLINLYGQTSYSGVTLLAKYSKTLAILPPPAGLAASDGLFDDRILLSWTATPGATSYLVYRGLIATASDTTYPEAYDEVSDNTYEDNDITLDRTKIYFYFVKAKIGNVKSVFSAGNSGYLMKAPLAPASVTATNGTYFDKIAVTWSKVADATSYQLYRSNSTNNSEKTMIATIPYDSRLLSIYSYNDVNSDTDTDPSPANTYNYWVEAVNGNGVSPLKQSATVGSIKKTGPMSVMASKGTYFKNVKITWLAVPGATGYDVYGSLTDKSADAGKLNDVSITGTEYYDAHDTTTTYFYWVVATFGTKYSSNFSTPVSSGNAKIAAQTTLAAPVMKSVSNGEGAFVRIAWAEVPLAATYSVYRRISATDTWVPLISGLTALTYINNDAALPPTPGQTYMYCVKAVNGDTSSPLSSSMSGYAGKLAASAIAYPTSSASFPGLLGSDGRYKVYQITVPSGVSRLVVKAEKVTGSCDLYAKLGMYPTTTSYNAMGTAITGTANKILTVTNPTAGEWYILLFGSGTAGYNYANLSINYYTETNIIFTQVPTNDLPVPFTATFKGRVQDIIGGLPGISLQVRNPITGIISWLPINTDTAGYFTYSTTINTEGEHTFDFFFTGIPDNAKGTASHTVATRKGCLETNNFFDFSAYLPATPIGLSTDLAGMQIFLDIRNGWAEGGIDTDYEALWMKNTIVAASTDAALLGKLDEGLYMFFYGVEGAGAGNDIAANSAFSAVPFVVHVASSKLEAVVTYLNGLGIIDDTQKDAILVDGKIGVVTVAAHSNPGEEPDGDKNIYLLAHEQLDVLANLAAGNGSFPENRKYSGVLTQKFTVDINGGTKQINVITSAFVK